MPECSRCKVETQLHVNGVPVCPDCDDAANPAQKKPPEGRMRVTTVPFSAVNSDSDRNLSIDRPGHGEYGIL
jgi:hypothetical protein